MGWAITHRGLGWSQDHFWGHIFGPEGQFFIAPSSDRTNGRDTRHLAPVPDLAPPGCGGILFAPATRACGRSQGRRHGRNGGERLWKRSYWEPERSRCSWGWGHWWKLPDTSEEEDGGSQITSQAAGNLVFLTYGESAGGAQPQSAETLGVSERMITPSRVDTGRRMRS
jgi:hypothetical protein